MADAAAVVVNYNGMPYVLETVRSLQAQSVPPSQIVVVDNGSTDGSVEALRALGSLNIIEAGRNLGFAEGCNVGVAHTSASYIAFLNSDATSDREWLAALSRVLDRDPNVAAVVGKIYFTEWMPHIEQAGGEFSDLGNFWGRGFPESDAGQFEREEEVAGITACAMLLRRDALHGEPPFDDELFMYGEELDLTLRLRARGLAIVYTPRAMAFHRGMHSVRKTREKPWLFQQFHANRNRAKLLLKYYPWSLLLRSVPLVAVSFLYWNAVALVRGGPRFFARAVAAQVRSAWAGLRQRDRFVIAEAPRWRPWMTKHSMRSLLARKRALDSSMTRRR